MFHCDKDAAIFNNIFEHSVPRFAFELTRSFARVIHPSIYLRRRDFRKKIQMTKMPKIFFEESFWQTTPTTTRKREGM